VTGVSRSVDRFFRLSRAKIEATNQEKGASRSLEKPPRPLLAAAALVPTLSPNMKLAARTACRLIKAGRRNPAGDAAEFMLAHGEPPRAGATFDTSGCQHVAHDADFRERVYASLLFLPGGFHDFVSLDGEFVIAGGGLGGAVESFVPREINKSICLFPFLAQPCFDLAKYAIEMPPVFVGNDRSAPAALALSCPAVFVIVVLRCEWAVADGAKIGTRTAVQSRSKRDSWELEEASENGRRFFLIEIRAKGRAAVRSIGSSVFQAECAPGVVRFISDVASGDPIGSARERLAVCGRGLERSTRSDTLSNGEAADRA
jgi:hypothetical protein